MLSRRGFAAGAAATAMSGPVAGQERKVDVDVLIIGAGAAGLAATDVLRRNGKRALCIEARLRPGGRVWTDHSIFGVPFDMGAHWLHQMPDNPLVEAGQNLGLSLYPQPDRTLVYDGASKLPQRTVAEFYRAYDAACDAIGAAAAAGRDVPAADVVPKGSDWAAEVDLLKGGYEMGRDLSRVSTLDWYSAADGADWFCAEGYGTLLTRHFDGVPVAHGVEAKRINWDQRVIRVDTTFGSIDARAVICTVSVGVMARGDIRFRPDLPHDMAEAFAGITMGSYNHIALKLPPDALGLAPDTELLAKGAGAGALANINGTGLTYVEVGGSLGRDLELAGQDAMVDYGIGFLVDIFGSDIKSKVEAARATRWGEDPLVWGCYSGANPGKAHLRAKLRDPIGAHVQYAGEATHPTQWATVHGAVAEGKRAAQEVLKTL